VLGYKDLATIATRTRPYPLRKVANPGAMYRIRCASTSGNIGNSTAVRDSAGWYGPVVAAVGELLREFGADDAHL